MTNENELRALVAKVESFGGRVELKLDDEALMFEGREVIVAVRITGLSGVGSCWMSALYAAETMRAIECPTATETRGTTPATPKAAPASRRTRSRSSIAAS
jgi:hypothetical protein